MKNLVKLATAISFLTSLRSQAQGCASCYTTAAAGGPQTAHALRSGILLLLLPPVTIFFCIVLSVCRWRPPGSNAFSSLFLSEMLHHKAHDASQPDETPTDTERRPAR